MTHTKLTRVLAVILTLLMLTTAASAASYGSEWAGYNAAATATYYDVPPEHWAYANIQRVSAQNWFSGYPDGSFRPNGTITRAEAVKVFVTFLSLQVSPISSSSFYDVDVNKWYAPFIEAGKDLFPTRTSMQGRIPFQPDMPVSREDTVYALVNALGFGSNLAVVDESVLNMFTDRNSISSNIRKHFAVALSNQLVSGYPDNTIRARDTLTRAEFATLLYRGTLVGFQDTNTAKIQSVTVSPVSPASMTIGENVTLTARAVYTDGTNQPYTDLQPYDASNNGVIAVSGTTVTALKAGNATIKFNDNYLKNETLVITVSAPTTAPTLRITDYPEQTEDESVTISGTVADASGTVSDLTCNGRDVTINGTSFSITVSLNEGSNSFKFIAKNQYGVTAEKTVTINRKAAAPKTLTVTFDPNGGSVAQNSKTVNIGEAIGDLPTANRTYFSFDGWYTSADGGDAVTSSSSFTADVTVYAHWKENSASGWVNAASVPANAEILERKYTYTQRQYSESNSSNKPGWIRYDSKQTGWSSRQGPVSSDPSNGSRKVTSEKYVTSSNYKTVYHYYRYANSRCATWGSSYAKDYPNLYRYDLDAPLVRKSGTSYSYKLPCTCGVLDDYHTVYSVDWQLGEPYQTKVKTSDNYGTRWYYQDPVYTYFFYRDISQESAARPSGNDISNVVELVRFREK